MSSSSIGTDDLTAVVSPQTGHLMDEIAPVSNGTGRSEMTPHGQGSFDMSLWCALRNLPLSFARA